VIGPAFSTAHDSGKVYIAPIRATNDDVIQEVPVLGSGMHPRGLQLIPLLKDCVGLCNLCTSMHFWSTWHSDSCRNACLWVDDRHWFDSPHQVGQMTRFSHTARLDLWNILVNMLSVRVPRCRKLQMTANLVWHRMLYSCTHMATVGVKGLSCCMMCVS